MTAKSGRMNEERDASASLSAELGERTADNPISASCLDSRLTGTTLIFSPRFAIAGAYVERRTSPVQNGTLQSKPSHNVYDEGLVMFQNGAILFRRHEVLQCWDG